MHTQTKKKQSLTYVTIYTLLVSNIRQLEKIFQNGPTNLLEEIIVLFPRKLVSNHINYMVIQVDNKKPFLHCNLVPRPTTFLVTRNLGVTSRV